MREKILVVEDEPSLVESLEYSLQQQGYEVVVAMDGDQALVNARQAQPDLILLDVMLPQRDGFEVCRILRQESVVPIIMLTARSDEIDEIVGLELGADDYLTKPFSMRTLLARVRAHLRRVRQLQTIASTSTQDESSIEKALPTFIFDNLTIDLKTRELLLDGEPIHVKPMEFDLLVYFAQHKRRVLSRKQMLKDVWEWNDAMDSRTIDVHVRWLREKIEADPANPKRIVTVRNIGYRFEG